MDNKRTRDAVDDETDAGLGKRMRLNDGSSSSSSSSSSAAAATALAGPEPGPGPSPSSMQAVAHEALAMSYGSGFTAINKAPRTAAASVAAAGAGAGAATPQPRPSPLPPSSTPPPPPPPPLSLTPSADHRRTATNSHHASGSRAVPGSVAGFAARNGISRAPGPPATPPDRPPTASLDTTSDITRRFKAAVANAWSRRAPTYSIIDVMLLHCEDDEPDIKTSVSSVEAAFRNRLHYPTEVCSIPSAEASHDAVRTKIEHFFSRDKSLDRLAILYYAGQCVSSSTADGQALFLVPRNRKAAASFPFAPIQAAYESTSCDVVLLMDHADAVPFPTLGPRNDHRNVVELIVAPTPDPELGLLSFAKALADELANKASSSSSSSTLADEPLRIEALHAAIAHRMSVSRPRGRGRPPKEPQARPPVDQRYLPKHQIFFHRRSVVLAPLPKEPQVILCLRVLGGGGTTDLDDWAKWIFNASPRARNTIQIEGLHAGFSTMLVLRVPVAEWQNFAECPTGSLVAFQIVGELSSPDLRESIDNELSAKLWGERGAASAAAPSPSSSVLQQRRRPSLSQPDPNPRPVKKQRKALPTERKLLPLGGPSLSMLSPVLPAAQHADKPQHRPTQEHLQKYLEAAQQQQQQQQHQSQGADRDVLDITTATTTAQQLAEAAQRPSKISIKQAEQSHMCNECKAGFKDSDTLYNHVRKQHTRPFHCVFNWASCESTFASKNEWKRHVMSQHILLHYWVCQVDQCLKIVNKTPGMAHSKFALPNGAIFNRKDLYTQHLRRMHTPLHVKKITKQVNKSTLKPPNHPAISDWESRLKELQEMGMRPRCRLPDFMRCPVHTCASDFHGSNAWDERMEHVARHLEAAAAGREPPVVFGGTSDPTLTDWATRHEVGIAKRVGPNTWHLDNPLRPEIMEWTGDSYGGGTADFDDAQGQYPSAEMYGQQQQQQHHHYQYQPQNELPQQYQHQHQHPHQHQHQHHQQQQHQHQHQHQFRVPNLHQRQSFPPPHAMPPPPPQVQYEQSPRPMQSRPQEPPTRQYARQSEHAHAEEAEWLGVLDRDEPQVIVVPDEDDDAASRETPTETPRTTRETPRETPVETPVESPEETPRETPRETRETSSHGQAAGHTPSEEPADLPPTEPMETAVPATTDAAKRPTRAASIDSDDERPNEDEITVATGSPRRV